MMLASASARRATRPWRTAPEAAPARASRRETRSSAWLTQAGLPTHPHDLGLRAAGLTGSWSAASDLHRLERAMPATWGGHGGEVGAVAAEHPVEQALALARLLTRLPVFRTDPLNEAERLAAALRLLGDTARHAARITPPEWRAAAGR